ncbi:hypothetical protein C8A00DRAFT_32232 [Chaetomidium leptoderma]|uniref:CFEM domain-containing protein n=1 Tax=Chaetomidium leptoderma TaxID=669021 RepID=A0AAN6VNR2_9PEZI|nr:hypothetical protein C8A00DRAFT_32232 [Chaetomidium leptoderma]
MQIKTVLIAAMAACATAQDISKIPACAIDCIIKTNPLSGCNSVLETLDFPCLCLTGEEYNNAIATCIVGACTNLNDVLAMVQWKTDACALYGVVWP